MREIKRITRDRYLTPEEAAKNNKIIGQVEREFPPPERLSMLHEALQAAKTEGLDKANEILGGYGIEHISRAGRNLSYVNMGETCAVTICQEGSQEPFIDSWGAWLEHVELEHCEANGLITCGHCSEFTPKHKTDWHKTVCKHCGKYVDGGDKPSSNRITGRQLAAKLLATKNPDAVVSLSIEGIAYSDFNDDVFDDSQLPDMDGAIGNILLHVCQDSELGQMDFD